MGFIISLPSPNSIRHSGLPDQRIPSQPAALPASLHGLHDGFQLNHSYTDYSVDLHDFCAELGRAPEILGFEALPGGWYIVASAVPITESTQVAVHRERWTKELLKLVFIIKVLCMVIYVMPTSSAQRMSLGCHDHRLGLGRQGEASDLSSSAFEQRFAWRPCL
jgi:hypothetical protein